MEKKSLSTEMPAKLVISLDELAKRTGRKKTVLVGASLNEFLEASSERQEEIIKQYLNSHKE